VKHVGGRGGRRKDGGREGGSEGQGMSDEELYRGTRWQLAAERASWNCSPGPTLPLPLAAAAADPWAARAAPAAPQQKALSPAFRRMSTTDLKANHSGISSPARSLLRNSVPLSLTTFLPAFLAVLS